MTPTETQLIAILTRELKLQTAHPITPDTRIFGKEGLGLDSVDVLEIAVLLDKHFNVMLSEQNEEVNAALATLHTLAAFIDRHRPPPPLPAA
jgi:acyl carrier protein